MGYSSESRKVLEKRLEVLEMMKSHPNYKEPVPLPDESPIAFALRAASHLVSPPQEPGESYDLECVDVASGILALKNQLEEAWKNK